LLVVPTQLCLAPPPLTPLTLLPLPLLPLLLLLLLLPLLLLLRNFQLCIFQHTRRPRKQ
jgi:hypothetical protein